MRQNRQDEDRTQTHWNVMVVWNLPLNPENWILKAATQREQREREHRQEEEREKERKKERERE